MTLNLSLPDQFAAPFDVQPVEPTAWHASGPLVPLGEDGTQTPAFLIRARVLTDEHPDLAITWAQRAQAAQAAREPDEAVRAATRAIHLGVAQASAPATHAALVVLSAAGQTQGLRALLDDPRAAELPTPLRARAAVELRDIDAALHLLGDGSSPEALAVRAWIEIERRDFHAAIRASRKAQRAGGIGPALLTNLGFAHAALGNLDKAIRITRQAAALSPCDRTIAFNLARYNLACGQFDDAIAVLEQLKTGPRPDFVLALAIAEIHTHAGDLEKAHRVLQQVRTSQEWARATTVRRCELDANLALLRWSTKRSETKTAVAAVVRALEGCDFESVSIAYMLLNLLQEAREADTLAPVIEALEPKHAPRELLPLRMHLAVLRHQADLAVEYARAWADAEILNDAAAAVAIHLLVDLQGEEEAGVELARRALPRNPVSSYLINNAAYALSLAGHPDKALEMLDRLPPEEGKVAVTATRALAQMIAGDITAGVRGYGDAHQIAEQAGNASLALLVDINLILALHRLSGGAGHEALAAISPIEVPAELAGRVEFWLVAERARRELGADMNSWFPGLREQVRRP